MPSACARATQSSSARNDPKRDGLMLRKRGSVLRPARSATTSTSPHEWIGASKLKRSSSPSNAARAGPSSVGERTCDRRVLEGVRCVVDGRALVERLEVEGADAARGGDARHGVRVPLGRRVELELELGVDRQPRGDVEARRDDEAYGAVLEAERRAQRPARLTKGQIECGALEGPAAV